MPQAEYAYNDTKNRTKCKHPFEVIYSMHPRGICELRELGMLTNKSGYAKDISLSMKEIHDFVKKNLIQNTNKIK